MSLLRRISPATAISLGVAFVTSAVILASAGTVLTKDYPPRLAVEVHGVPGYVYYDRDYPITIEYANIGRDAAHSASVSAIIPAGFTLDGVTHATSDEPQRFVWNVGDLAPGQRGEITAKLRGILPSDLTGAVYDLPGYVGHTAFVDGFKIDVALTAHGGHATQTASADTGGAVVCNSLTQLANCLYIIKEVVPDDGTQFEFALAVAGLVQPNFFLGDGQFRGIPIPANPSDVVLVSEFGQLGWSFSNLSCSQQSGVLVVIPPFTAAIQVGRDPQATAVASAVCTFVNEELPEPTPEPTPRPDPTPRPSPTTQPNLGGGLGGLFAGQPTALPTARAATAAAANTPAITPPRTGDAGLK